MRATIDPPKRLLREVDSEGASRPLDVAEAPAAITERCNAAHGPADADDAVLGDDRYVGQPVGERQLSRGAGLGD